MDELNTLMKEKEDQILSLERIIEDFDLKEKEKDE